MADKPNRKIVDYVEERGQIENVFGNTINRTGGPSTVAVPAQIERIDVIVPTQDLGNPVPIARVVESTVHQDQRGLAVLAIIPKLQLEPVGIEEVGDGFHGFVRCWDEQRKYTGFGQIARRREAKRFRQRARRAAQRHREKSSDGGETNALRAS